MTEEKDYLFAAIVFDGKDTAEQTLKKVRELKKDDKFTLEDMVAVNKNEKGKVKLKQGRNLTGKRGVAGFGALGLLAGGLLGGPIAGAAIGAALGSAGSQIKKVFGNDELKALGEDLDQDSSMLFLLVSDAEEGALEAAMDEFGGKMYAFVMAEEGLMAMGAITEDESFLAVIQEEIIEIDLADPSDEDMCETKECDENGVCKCA